MINWDDIKKLYLENHVINNNTNNVVSNNNDDTEYTGYGKSWIINDNVSKLKLTKVYGNSIRCVNVIKPGNGIGTSCTVTASSQYTSVTYSSKNGSCVWNAYNDTTSKMISGHTYALRIKYRTSNHSKNVIGGKFNIGDHSTTVANSYNTTSTFYALKKCTSNNDDFKFSMTWSRSYNTNVTIYIYDIILIDVTEALGYSPWQKQVGFMNSYDLRSEYTTLLNQVDGTSDYGCIVPCQPHIYNKLKITDNVHSFYPDFDNITVRDSNTDIYIGSNPDQRTFYIDSDMSTETSEDHTININLFENYETYPLTVGHKYFSIMYYSTYNPFGVWSYTINDATDNSHGCIFTATDTCVLSLNIPATVDGYSEGRNHHIIDLTELFGSGNEPITIDDVRITGLETWLQQYRESTDTIFTVSTITDSDTISLSTDLYGCGSTNGDYMDIVNKKKIIRTDDMIMNNLTWSTIGYGYFTASIPNDMKNEGYCYCSKYKYVDVDDYTDLNCKEMTCIDNTIYVREASTLSLANFLSGIPNAVYLYYEKTTPTEETLSDQELGDLVNVYDVGYFNAIDLLCTGDFNGTTTTIYKNDDVVTDGQIVKIQCGSRIIWERN